MAGPRLALVDYGMGNRRSVEKALEHVGARPLVSGDPEALQHADGLVVPGVGAFPLAMRRLRERGLDEAIAAHVSRGRPLLGICLGMQLLFERSEEIESTPGLGLIPGEVRRLQAGGLRVPHIGWNTVRIERESPLFAGLPRPECPFYHVHSYVAVPEDPEHTAATAEYGERFATAVGRNLVLGVQFHPEKSSRHGLRMLENFASLCGGRPARAGLAAAPGEGARS